MATQDNVCWYVPVDRYPTKQGQVIALRKLLRKRGEDYKQKLVDNGLVDWIDANKTEYRRFDPVR